MVTVGDAQFPVDDEVIHTNRELRNSDIVRVLTSLGMRFEKRAKVEFDCPVHGIIWERELKCEYCERDAQTVKMLGG